MTNTQKLAGPIFVTLALAVYGVSNAFDMRWVCDDAFISFRYAKNLADGLGLVFNAGEYVEGYTNFLWTLIMALGLKANIDPVALSESLGITFYLATGALLLHHSLSVQRQRTVKGALIPLAAISFFLHRDLQVWATGGLETAMVMFFITAGFIQLIMAESKKQWIFSGVYFTLATMTRPDAVIIYIAALIFLALWERNPRVVAYTAIPGLVVIAHWLWRYSYYGHWLPNTYYAKSVGLSWWSQGAMYVWLYLKSYYALIPTIPLALLALYETVRRVRKNRVSKRNDDDITLKSFVGALALAGAYTLSVMRVGGDFMFARLLIPITPLFLISVESALSHYFRRNRLRVTLAVLFSAAIFFNINLFAGLGQIHGIADESKYYPPARHAEEKRIGEMLRPIFAETGAQVGFYGMRATMIYYANPVLAVECQTGLTDEYIAHLPIEKRGRPGHEKEAPEEYLYQRKLHFLLKTVYDFTLPQDKLRKLQIEDYSTYILTYDNEVMDKLKDNPNCSFVDFQEYLDGYIKNLPNLSVDRVARDFKMFKRYYFDVNDDTARLAPFIEKLKTKASE